MSAGCIRQRLFCGSAKRRKVIWCVCLLLGLPLLTDTTRVAAEPSPTGRPEAAVVDRSLFERLASPGEPISAPTPPRPSEGSRYRDLVTREAQRQGLPPALADAVAYVESGYNPGVVGSVGELGLMQVRPSTAAMLGYTGPIAGLSDPETNIRFGVTYLKQAWSLAKGDLCRTLMKYRAGHGEERMSLRSVEYCRRARSHLAAIGSSLATALLPATASTRGARDRSPMMSSGERGQAVLAAIAGRLWAEHAVRVRAIEARTERVMRGG